MATQTWIPDTIGDWFTAANWTSGSVPTTGDSAIIGSGMPTIASGAPSITREQIVLGGSQLASLVTLEAVGATFSGTGDPTDMTLTVTGGDPSTGGLAATFLVEGATSFHGQIYVQTINGGLTINSQSDGTPGNFTISNDEGDGLVLVSHASYLRLTGQTITNRGTIEVDGFLDRRRGHPAGGRLHRPRDQRASFRRRYRRAGPANRIRGRNRAADDHGDPAVQRADQPHRERRSHRPDRDCGAVPKLRAGQ